MASKRHALKISMAGKAQTDNIPFEQGWPVLQQAFNQLIGIVEELPGHHHFTSQDYMAFYTTVYNMASRLGPEQQYLYDHYRKIFEEYLTSKVLPALREKKDTRLLQELVKRWDGHKIMTSWFARFFKYLDRYFVAIRRLPTMQEVAYLTFHELVYGEMNDQVRDTVIYMIDQEREGEPVDQALVKSVLDIYVEMGQGSLKYFEEHFEEQLLKKTASFYLQKASNWITGESYSSYMLKVDDCLKMEQNMVSTCLPPRIQEKLLKVVEHELLYAYASNLEEMKLLEFKGAHKDA